MAKLRREYNHSRHSRILVLTPPPIDREVLGKYHRRKGTDRSFDVAVILVLRSVDDNIGVLDFYTVFMEQVTDAPLMTTECPH